MTGGQDGAGAGCGAAIGVDFTGALRFGAAFFAFVGFFFAAFFAPFLATFSVFFLAGAAFFFFPGFFFAFDFFAMIVLPIHVKVGRPPKWETGFTPQSRPRLAQ